MEIDTTNRHVSFTNPKSFVPNSSQMEIDTSYRKENISVGAKDKRIAPIDYGSKIPTDNKLPKKGNMRDKQMAATDANKTYTLVLDQLIRKPKVTVNWNPEILKVTHNQYGALTYEEKRLWLISHFYFRKYARVFRDDRLRSITEADVQAMFGGRRALKMGDACLLEKK
ncbi:uncharacterized protein [Rutidosis leptorrhynchoides]|uniref:uncharacterized protein isoform X1 n=1 Tax=Rutidosis leptorrhynchoides TaxID=125765 RepID=UPI003A994732